MSGLAQESLTMKGRTVQHLGITVSISILGRRACALAVCLLFFLSGSSGADNLIQIYTLALENDPELQRAFHENLASQEALTQAYSGLLPTLTLDAETGRTRQNVRSSNNDFFTTGSLSFTNRRATLTLNQPVFRPASIVSLRQAKAGVKRADLEFERVKQDLILRVATLYFEALSAQDRLTFAEAQHAALQLHFELAQIQRQKGLLSISDLYDARARLASVEALVIESEDLWDDAVQALQEASGVISIHLSGVKKELALAGPDPGDVELWIQAALEQNLGLKAQGHAVEVARQEILRQRSSLYPALDLVARGNRERSGGSLFGGGSDVETANFLLRLSIPLYQGGFLRSRIREATHRYRGTLEEEEGLLRAVKRQVRAAYFGVTRAIGRVEALNQAVASQELALEARQDGFKSGKFSSLEVLDAERDLFQARRDFARAHYDYILNSLRLKQAVGILNGADLLAVNQWLN